MFMKQVSLFVGGDKVIVIGQNDYLSARYFSLIRFPN